MSADAIAERLERFRRSNDPTVLWPAVTEPEFHAALEHIERVSRLLLGPTPPASPASPAPPTPVLDVPPGGNPEALGVALFMSGMGPLLGYWCETGALRAGPALRDLLARHLDHGRQRAARMQRELASLRDALAARRVAMVLLKGAHTAAAYFPEPGTRPMADLDVLVRPDDVAAARGALRDLGFVEFKTEGRPHRSDWARPGSRSIASLEIDHVDNPWSIDLHVSLDRSLSPGVVAHLDQRDLDPEARVLPQPLLLAYLACHAADHLWSLQLIRLAELVLVGRRDFTEPATWTALEDLLARTRTARFAYPTLTLAERFVPGTVPADLLERLARQAPRQLRRYVARTTPARAQRFRRPQPGHWFWPGSPRERLALLFHFVWPQDANGALPWRAALARQRDRLRRLAQEALRRVFPPRGGGRGRAHRTSSR